MKPACPSLSLFAYSAAVIIATVAGVSVARAAETYKLDLSQAPAVVRRGELDLGGTGPRGSSIAVNDLYIEKDGKPYIPIVGEFHYSRYPAEDWEEELLKIKAGGINVVSTYVFWNMHERKAGQFDWAGRLDLRRFVELVDKVGLKMILRIGPFGHGEIRNGGLPDWLYGQAFEVRSNDPGYLACVDKLYAAIAGQVSGLLFKDGGPIIGIQLENEFQHSAAPWDIRYQGAPIVRTVAERDLAVTHGGVAVSEVKNENSAFGRDHMVNLKLIAKRHGLDVPIYTATGWGNAAIVPKGSIPVTAAYPYPFWTEKATASSFYLFKDIRKYPDYAPVSYDTDLYPSLPAELGAGISPTYSRRAYVPEESVAPMIVRVLGSGSNGIGYYMYHGGATPAFDRFYNEDTSGLPKINYDYQAPIGQYGRAKSHYFSLRPLHLFLASYGERLAPLPPILPATRAQIAPTDVKTLRYAARAANGSGFVFLLNFQDHVEVQDLPDLQLALNDGHRIITIPSRGTFTLKKNAAVILPVNLDLDGTTLRSATVQPLTILRGAEGARFVFFSLDGLAPEFVFDGGVVRDAENCRLTEASGTTIVRGPANACFSFSIDGKSMLVVPQRMALQAVPVGTEQLLFADATVMPNASEATLLSAGRASVAVSLYPASGIEPHVTGARVKAIQAPSRTMSAFRVTFTPAKVSATWREVAPRRYALHVDAGLDDLHDVFMRVNYIGDTGMAFIDGQMVDDDFYYGRPWEIGLKRFMPLLKRSEMIFVFQPMQRDATYMRDIPVAFRPKFARGERQHFEFDGFEFIPEYRAVISLPRGR